MEGGIEGEKEEEGRGERWRGRRRKKGGGEDGGGK